MTIDTLLKNPDIYVLFDGCPTCHPETSKYLEKCQTQAQHKQRRLHVVPSGSPTATLIRTIATKQGHRIEYPMILMEGLILTNPQDITTPNERTTE